MAQAMALTGATSHSERILQRELQLPHGLGRSDDAETLRGERTRRGRIPVRVIGKVE
jgi:hypothetical protein